MPQPAIDATDPHQLLLQKKAKQKWQRLNDASRVRTDRLRVIARSQKLKSDYYYSYAPFEETLTEVDQTAWTRSEGVVTESDVGHHSYYFEFNSTSTKYNEFFETVEPFLSNGCRSLWIVPTPIVAACSTWRDIPEEERLENLKSCRAIQPEIQAGMSPKPYVAVTAMHKDRETFQGLGVFGSGLPSKAESTRQHFLQFLSLETKAKVNDPVRIPMITDMGGSKPRLGRDLLVDMVWSADARFVVYVGLTSLAIVDVEKLAAEN